MKRVQITKDEVSSVVRNLNQLTRSEVLIGIPEKKTQRWVDRKRVSMTNAALGYIHEFGSPAANIPARPFLIPGVKKAESKALIYLRGAAEAALDNRPDQMKSMLVSAGLIAEDSAKREIRTGNFAPLKPGTIANRFKGRGRRRESEQHYIEMVRGGMAPAAAQQAAGIRPLINTAQLANSITSVVRSRGKTST